MAALAAAAVLFPIALPAQQDKPWLDTHRSPDVRAALAIGAMTLSEKLGLLHGLMALPNPVPGSESVELPPEAIPAAGYVPGVPRLGIPALYETDASLGVTNPRGARPGDVATALPAALALASTFDPRIAYAAGALVGREARSKGFNVLLGGGMNLARDPRNGRNFEYLGEDPWLAGVMASASVRGTQDQRVISTVKHFALNANETNRWTLDARIDEAALRESDLLAFEIAIERGRPGAVMCAYNKVNGVYSCGNSWLLNDVLKHDWGYRGWVMSDWGAVHAADYALQGLDQESGEQLDGSVWFGTPLAIEVAQGQVPMARIDDMVHRILRSMFAVGIAGSAAETPIDYKSHSTVALDIARQGIVLLKNAGNILPVNTGLRRIAVIGGHADVGVLSGGGSSQVTPSNGSVVRITAEGNGTAARSPSEIYFPSSPLDAIRTAAPGTEVLYGSGATPADAAALASRADIAIVFVGRHEMEGHDSPNLELPDGQNALIESVAGANARTVVVLETGNPVSMPWLPRVAGVLAAWYPGQEGGRAIADILFGSVNPSGRLPMTFPIDDGETVRPILPNLGAASGAEVAIDYGEGADVGYRWYAKEGRVPLFAFGYGQSYTRFEYDRFQAAIGAELTVSFRVRNVGNRKGADVPQVYLTSAHGTAALRLLAFQKIALRPGEARSVRLSVDRRLLVEYDAARHQWAAPAGAYQLSLRRSALATAGEATATVRY